MNIENVFYVYEWYIKDTNEVFYVGKGKGNRYKKIIGRNNYFQCIYKTHDCGVRKIYENLTEKDAFNKEKETIKYYKDNTNYRLTNQTDGGEGTSGWKPTDEFKNKQSIIHRNQWQNDDFRNKMIQIRNSENSPYKSKEFRNKISNIVKGEKNPNFNHHWNEDQKKALSEKQRENNLYKNENNPNAKKIICIETGEVFACIKYAREKYDIRSDGSITVALKNKGRTAGGLHWVYYSDCYLNKNYRYNYLYNVLLEYNKNPMICITDNKLYSSRVELAKELGVTDTKISYHLTKNKKFLYNDKIYMLLKEYNSRYV